MVRSVVAATSGVPRKTTRFLLLVVALEYNRKKTRCAVYEAARDLGELHDGRDDADRC